MHHTKILQGLQDPARLPISPAAEKHPNTMMRLRAFVSRLFDCATHRRTSSALRRPSPTRWDGVLIGSVLARLSTACSQNRRARVTDGFDDVCVLLYNGDTNPTF